MGRKLDLSKLTDEEAKHVWEVVQRDFDLRKKEEARLEDLKGKIEKESTKRELLSTQSQINETHCIHCLQPFKFLVNSKRQCLDCQLYTCKNCSRFNKREQGWVCDPCRLSRIVETGTLEWYYEHVRSRFKQFGSAKVMQSLYGRMKMNPTFLGMGKGLGLHDRVYSLPNINSDYQFYNENDRSEEEETSDAISSAEAEGYSEMRQTKRLLSVHPFDFEMDSEYSAQSRRQSMQLSPGPDGEGLQAFAEFPGAEESASQKESMIAEADLAAAFYHILQEQGQRTSPPEQEFSTEVLLATNSHPKVLEKQHKADILWNEQHQSSYSADMDTSDEDTKGAQKLLAHQPHHPKRRSQASSQENINHSGNQILELNKRMSAIECMLNRLEEKILVHSEPLAPESQMDPNIEEKELKRKLEEMASNISDKAVSSEEEEGGGGKKTNECEAKMSSSSDDLPIDAKEVCLSDGRAYGPEKKLGAQTDHAHHSAATDSELSELEDKVALAVAQVQHTESEVSDIESRIAALSAAGLTVKPMEKSRKKMSSKVMSMPHVLRRKFNTPLEIASNAESFARNSCYRGSLTQRNPNGRNRKADHIFAASIQDLVHSLYTG
ncbi:melanophilin [Varanus komodoensis]|uniref:melanophilin n=1 Tax=Varanus komodoensis TaxID=61221 RepID=UPI001CF7B45A|nr:melanophilin [Varanus komodoensis]